MRYKNITHFKINNFCVKLKIYRLGNRKICISIDYKKTFHSTIDFKISQACAVDYKINTTFSFKV